MADMILRQRLRNGEVVLGIWGVLSSPQVASVIGASGMDFLIIDLEHSSTTLETAGAMAYAALAEGCRPIVRLGGIDEAEILRCLDLGVDGVLVAHVETAQDARDVVSFCKYHPEGRRGYSPFTPAGKYGAGKVEDHARIQNQRTLVGVILEGETGINNIEEIIATEGLDLVYIGAYDLSQALGMPGQVNHPAVRSRMEACIKQVRNAGLAAGGFVAKSAADIDWMVDMGMQFITFLPDSAVLLMGCNKACQDLQAKLKK